MNTLDSNQSAAALTNEPVLVVAAGPGSGKTAVICERVRELLRRGGSPCVVTLTNSAADEVKSRLGDLAARLYHCGTIHALALRIVEDVYPGLAVVTAGGAERLEADARARVGYKGPLRDFTEAKRRLLETGLITSPNRLAEMAVMSWINLQRSNHAWTFDGLIYEACEPLAVCRLNDGSIDLVVDEAQDCSASDHRLFRMLRPRSAFYVGDADQAIFGFRGGSLESFSALAARHPVATLEQSYRCPEAVAKLAEKIVAPNKHRIQKRLIPSGKIGSMAVNSYDSIDEECAVIESFVWHADLAALSWAVLCRTNMVLDEVRRLIGIKPPESALPRDWAKASAILAAFACPENDWTAAAAAEAAGLGDARRIRAECAAEKVAVYEKLFGPRVNDWAETFMRLELWVSPESLAFCVQHASGPGLTSEWLVGIEEMDEGEDDRCAVTTIHGAKGREFDQV